MSISCVCGGDYEWYSIKPTDYTTMEHLARRKRCCSCKEMIDSGSTCVEFLRYSENDDGVDAKLASYWMCEDCGDMFFNLIEYGYRISFPADMREDLKTHQEKEGFERELGDKIKKSNDALLEMSGKDQAADQQLQEHE